MWWRVRCRRNLHHTLIWALFLLCAQGVVSSKRRLPSDKLYSTNVGAEGDGGYISDEDEPTDFHRGLAPAPGGAVGRPPDRTNLRHKRLHSYKNAFGNSERQENPAKSMTSSRRSARAAAVKAVRHGAAVAPVTKMRKIKSKDLSVSASEHTQGIASTTSPLPSVSSTDSDSILRPRVMRKDLLNYEEDTVGRKVHLKPRVRNQELFDEWPVDDNESTEHSRAATTHASNNKTVIVLSLGYKIALYVIIVIFIYTIVVTLLAHLYCFYKCCMRGEDELL